MTPYKVSINLKALDDKQALEKAEILSRIADSVTMDNLKFLGELSKKPTINKKLSNPIIRAAIKSKL